MSCNHCFGAARGAKAKRSPEPQWLLCREKSKDPAAHEPTSATRQDPLRFMPCRFHGTYHVQWALLPPAVAWRRPDPKLPCAQTSATRQDPLRLMPCRLHGTYHVQWALLPPSVALWRPDPKLPCVPVWILRGVGEKKLWHLHHVG